MLGYLSCCASAVPGSGMAGLGRAGTWVGIADRFTAQMPSMTMTAQEVSSGSTMALSSPILLGQAVAGPELVDPPPAEEPSVLQQAVAIPGQVVGGVVGAAQGVVQGFQPVLKTVAQDPFLSQLAQMGMAKLTGGQPQAAQPQAQGSGISTTSVLLGLGGVVGLGLLIGARGARGRRR